MPKRASDLTGKRFGKRLVLGRGQDAFSAGSPYGRVRWIVRCDCGHDFLCLTQGLTRDSNKNCRKCGFKGVRPHRRKRPYEVTYNSLVQRARHPVLITYEQYLSFTKQTECHYCGEPITWCEYRNPKKHAGCGSNLDRKDASKPYEMGNIVVCCRRCNYGKNNFFSYAEWKEIGGLIRSWRQKEIEAEQEKKKK